MVPCSVIKVDEGGLCSSLGGHKGGVLLFISVMTEGPLADSWLSVVFTNSIMEILCEVTGG